ncbi:hypothetical protein [Enterococcus casseliflavus]|uniref:hypothetical protein n=1 Tax=Enterococcus casseliflavus TaxID=37734 RepID=UPI002DBAC8E4|nr:hypothetical protein [Enterococcus casseliflavus]MEB6147361.1 hypothetical protein [Enterococcus casseliflavus]MEB8400297.1 hypothetical protein [Enterococcus casseliflavus]
MNYSLNQELIINGLIKEKITDLQQFIHDKKDLLSDRQLESARRDLKQYQDLQYQNRLNRQINI